MLAHTGQALPELFGNVWHEGVQEPQRLFQNRDQASTGLVPFSTRGFVGYIRFGQLYIPVAEIIPEEVIEGLDSLVKRIILNRSVDGLSGAVQSRDYPAVMQRESVNPAANGLRVNHCSV